MHHIHALQLWAEALRSGEYHKCKYIMRNDEGCYCALGVLCEVYRRETGDGVWQDGSFRTLRGLEATKLPVDVYQWVGSHCATVFLPPPKWVKTTLDVLTTQCLNDYFNLPFRVIADQIDELIATEGGG